jgi:ubiquitin C-terminal hydrolase
VNEFIPFLYTGKTIRNDHNLDSNPNKPTDTAQAGRSTEDERSQRDEVVAKQNRTSSTNGGHKCCRFIETPMAPGQSRPIIQCSGSEALGLKETTTADNHVAEVLYPESHEINDSNTSYQSDNFHYDEDNDDGHLHIHDAFDVLEKDVREVLLRREVDEKTYKRIELLLIDARQIFDENRTEVSITRPASGLQNPKGHNLCYVNSLLQILNAMKCITDIFLNGVFASILNNAGDEHILRRGTVAIAIHKMFRDMNSFQHPQSAHGFRDAHTTETDKYDNKSQQDCHEFAIDTVDSLHESLIRNDNRTSLISDIFRCKTISKLSCNDCGTSPEPHVEDAMGVFVEIPNVNGPTSLVDCLNCFCSEEVLDEANSYMCGTCNRGVRATKKLHLNATSVLMITLKRFIPVFERNSDGENVCITTKIHRVVTFPMEGLDLGPYSFTHAPGEQNLYKVFGVQCHVGETAESGHYYSYVYNFGHWWKCDDVKVTRVDSSEVASDNNVYSLYYCTQSNFDEMIGIQTQSGKKMVGVSVFSCVCARVCVLL